GSFIIVLDAPSRENEGDLIIAAAHLTTRKAAFLIAHTSGYLCAPMPTSRADALDLPLMVPAEESQDVHRTAYTVSVDAVGIVTTGISAHDRALTSRTLAHPLAKPSHLRRPGHIIPLRARDGGVRTRRGHTEATVEFCRLAGIEPAVGVIGELVTDGGVVEGVAEREGGGMMRRDECLAFGRRFGIRVVTIGDLVEWVEAREGVLGDGEGGDY
ncbi:3,4-dihydroxy-2-butanone 4-phosphate synthase, partial [Pseudovirgaria hyperparasitica]